MQINNLHSWHINPSAAIPLQKRLAEKVVTMGEISNPCFIAGMDISVRRGSNAATAAVVVLSYPELEIVEVQVVKAALDFPTYPVCFHSEKRLLLSPPAKAEPLSGPVSG